MTYEVAVVGAGPAGSITAALLAARGHSVVLFDRARFPRSKACAEYTSPGAVALLCRLGVTPRADRLLRGMLLRAPGGASHLIEYGRTPGGAVSRALSMPRRELDAVLVDIARARGVDVREGVRVLAPLLHQGAVSGVVAQVPGSLPLEIPAQFVVVADGLHSTVTRALGLRRTTGWPPRLGLTAHLRGVVWPEDYGEMWVGRRGYVGVAPVGDGVLSVGLVTALPCGRLGPPGRALWGALANFPHLAERLAQAEVVGNVHGIGPLGRTVSASAGRGFVLVGDAAGFFDPFTGEGIYRALRGAELAAEAVHGALCGDTRASSGYAHERRRAFASKERLTRIIQLFVRAPALMDYAVGRLRQRPRLAAQLGRVLGDLEPAAAAARPSYLWALLKP